jgi:hypothetical protein
MIQNASVKAYEEEIVFTLSARQKQVLEVMRRGESLHQYGALPAPRLADQFNNSASERIEEKRPVEREWKTRVQGDRPILPHMANQSASRKFILTLYPGYPHAISKIPL